MMSRMKRPCLSRMKEVDEGCNLYVPSSVGQLGNISWGPRLGSQAIQIC